MTMDKIHLNEMFLYWKLKELEELRWSGALYFVEQQTVTGRLFLNGGYLSWAEAAGQTMSLFSAMQSFAQVDRDDILFADSMYKEQGENKNFVEVLENSGLVSFWTLRECMRAHIYAAVEKIGEKPGVQIIEDDSKVAQASQHVFTIDELEYAVPYSQALPKPLLGAEPTDVVEVRLRTRGLILRYPEGAEEDKIAEEVAQAHRACLANFEDFIPTLLYYRYPDMTYMAMELLDVYRTTIVLGTSKGSALDRLATSLATTPTALVMHIAESTIPLLNMNDPDEMR